jgi:hypothetical protein
MTFNRTAPLAGIPAVMLIVAGAIAAGDTPKPDASVDELVTFYTEHDTGQVTSGVLLSLGAIFFLVFSAAFIDSIRRAEANSRTASALCFGGGVLFAGGLALAAGLGVFIGDVARDVDPSALQALHELSLVVVFPWTVGACAFLLGAGTAVLQTGVLASWLGWLAVVLGVVAAIPSHVLGGVLDHIGVLPVAGLGLWTLVVSVLLVRRADAER